MLVAPFSPADIEEVIVLARQSHAESRFAPIAFDEHKVREGMRRMAAQPAGSNCAIVVRNHGGRLVGYLAGTIEEYFFSHARVASSVFLFVDPRERGGLAAVKLVLAFRRWAQNRGAAELYVGIASGVTTERTGRFLQRLGLQHTGGNYSQWLTGQGQQQAV